MFSVILNKIGSYEDTTALKEFFARAVALSGKQSLHGRKVLVKPNFLKYAPPEKPVTTHPVFLMTLIELFKDMGASVIIGDSPGIGSFENICGRLGLIPFFDRHNVSIADFSRTITVANPAPILFREFELPEALFNADTIVNLPRLKTHQMMTLTFAVKNLYGCIYGMKKVKFHLTAGENREFFASLLLDLYTILKPGINIVDGIWGMEGEGPASGTPRKFDIVCAGTDALAVDTMLARILSVRADAVPILRVAVKHGFAAVKEENIRMRGLQSDQFRIDPIRLPKASSVDFSVPGFMKRMAKRFIFSYPRVTSVCKSCGACKAHCPINAITMKEKAVIDTSLCIRCFCCQEVCDHDAVEVKKRLF